MTVSFVSIPAGFTESDIQWEKQPTEGVTFTLVQDGGTVFPFNSVSVEDAGVYAVYWRGLRGAYWFSLFRLIVRGEVKCSKCQLFFFFFFFFMDGIVLRGKMFL